MAWTRVFSEMHFQVIVPGENDATQRSDFLILFVEPIVPKLSVQINPIRLKVEGTTAQGRLLPVLRALCHCLSSDSAGPAAQPASSHPNRSTLHGPGVRQVDCVNDSSP